MAAAGDGQGAGSTAIEDLWAVVPAGGAGTRLWPLSRVTSPKFLHDLTGSGRTLLQETHDRLQPLVEDRLIVVTGVAHRDAVAAQLDGVAEAAILAEPSPRDSMAAIGLAAAILEREHPEAVLGSFAADHVVRDRDAFAAAVRAAVAVAREDWLVTIGIDPTFPSSAFGYVHLGEPMAGHEGAWTVEEFVEKPSTTVAAGYLATGEYRWNAGMFVVRPGVLLELLHQWHPDLTASLRAIAADRSRLAELWPTLTKIAVDHAVAEPAAAAGRVATVPASFGWDDIGDFDSLATLLHGAAGPTDGTDGNDGAGEPAVVLGERSLVHTVDASGLVVPGSGRVVAVVGLEDVVVVDTPDALLVTTRARAQEVKQAVAALKDAGRSDLV